MEGLDKGLYIHYTGKGYTGAGHGCVGTGEGYLGAEEGIKAMKRTRQRPEKAR